MQAATLPPRTKPAVRLVAHIDFETRSPVDLKTAGVHRYATHPLTEILCLAWCLGDGPVSVWQPGQPFPAELDAHAAAGGWMAAHNAGFELSIWEHVLPRYVATVAPLLPERMTCTMARAAALALPQGLDDLAGYLRLSARKDDAGARLMRAMCSPGKDGTYRDTPEDRARLADYCRQDVEVERAADKRIPELSNSERAIWLLDWRINNRGVNLDLPSIIEAAREALADRKRLNACMTELTGGVVTTCTQTQRIGKFLAGIGCELPDLTGRTVDIAISNPATPDLARAVLQCRRDGSNASTSKLTAMLTSASPDGRARHLLRYHRASTGRWAGVRVQPQNMPRPRVKAYVIDLGFQALAIGALQAIPDWGDVLVSMLRGMLTASPGNVLYAVDFANIEGRVLAWLAGEDWKTGAFRAYDAGTGPDLYKLAYARAFGIHPDEVTKDQRQLGKVMELALGYQGSIGAYAAMGIGYGLAVIPDDATPGPMQLRVSDVKRLVYGWRDAHPATVQLWADLEAAAIAAVQTGQPVQCGRVAFAVSGGVLYCKLPSGRRLAYPRARMAAETRWTTSDAEWSDFTTLHKALQASRPKADREPLPKRERAETGRTVLQYQGGDAWPTSLYGGLLTENIVQAIARDLLADAMLRVDAAGMPIVLHVHDEIVIDALASRIDAKALDDLVALTPEWASGLPVAVESTISFRYAK